MSVTFSHSQTVVVSVVLLDLLEVDWGLAQALESRKQALVRQKHEFELVRGDGGQRG